MKKVLTFLSGFCCCLLVVLFLNSQTVDSYAIDNVLKFTKVTYPIYINGVKSDTEAYNYNGNTYLKIADLNKNLNNLSVYWSDEKKEVNVVEATGLGYMYKDGITYVDIRRMVQKSIPGMPHSYNTRTGNYLYTEGYDLKLDAESFWKNSTETYPHLYVKKDTFQTGLPLFLKMLSENEYELQNKLELFPDINDYDTIKDNY
jgi:hypothetical protein